MTCPDPERLFTESDAPDVAAHLAACEGCRSVVAAHREIERALGRLADPLPPPNFVAQVVSRVQTSPAPIRQELTVAAWVVLVPLALVTAQLFGGGLELGRLGRVVVQIVVTLRALWAATGALRHSMAGAAGIYLVVILACILLASLAGLRRLTFATVHNR